MAPYANSSVCLSEQCVQASSIIYSRLSSNFQNIDPCTNFEELVCGGVRERRVVPQWINHVREEFDMQDDTYIILKGILEAPYEKLNTSKPADQENFERLLTGYSACMNETAIAALGVQPLVTFLGNVTESFPVTEEEYKNPKPFGSADYKAFSDTFLFFLEHGQKAFFEFMVDVDPEFPDTMIPSLYPSALATAGVFGDEKTRSEFENVVAQTFAKLLPTDESKSAAGELARSLVDFQEKLATNTPTVVPLDHIVNSTVKTATQLAPAFDLSSVLSKISPAPVDRIIFPYPEYSTWLSQTLANTTKPTIQAFFLWQAILGYQAAVDGPELQPLRALVNSLREKPAGWTDERWRTCITEADQTQAWSLSKLWTDRKYTEETHQTVKDMATKIQNRLASNIDKIEWMSDKVKAIAKHKVESITQKLGVPTEKPNLADANSVKDFYNGLEMTDSYFNNNINWSKWQVQKNAARIKDGMGKGEWAVDSAPSALTMNAFYSPLENSITIIAGTLQEVVLDAALPSYMNYGALGFIVGHEYTHSLDSSGRLFDEHGKLTNWWDAESEAGFNNRTQCLINQYETNKVKMPDGSLMAVNGTNTLGENIADTGGVNVAWDAWQDKRRDDPASDFDLPALNDVFTHEQLFYVAASQWFCDKSNDPGILEYMGDVHSPPWIRVKAVTENSKGFLNAFNCPKKEPTCVIY
ncbi:Metalloprotease [Hypoxylon trugodes]|uniref:Metalloprotease n=1 Tax=Hypoxylon trugodes TaxID=326681 RepID=UPI0021908226|nr:Metalloprotease [Hypoxylon trugodes]KAI1383461.1 Metalloprotease [Hypoxylon trugodes]